MKNQLKCAIINLLNIDSHSHPRIFPKNMIIKSKYHLIKEKLIYKDKIFKNHMNLRIAKSKIISTKKIWNNYRNH